jgi:hypothetical protein
MVCRSASTDVGPLCDFRRSALWLRPEAPTNTACNMTRSPAHDSEYSSNCVLLRGRGESPRHSITSSACASSLCETARPSDFAVLRLRTKRKRVGCSNGSSAGFAPLRMRSTSAATRLKVSP